MKRLFLPLALVGFFVACAPATPNNTGIVDETTAPLWLSPGVTLWPHSGSGPASIHVCFRTSDIPATMRAHIRTVVEENWERAAFVDFFDWGICSPLPAGNAIVILMDPSIAPNLGQSDVGVVSGRPNVITYASASPSDHTILHEFGHALGFSHENTDTTPISCTQHTSGGTSEEGQGDLALSVMSQSACNVMSSLSAWDIMGVRKVYGVKPAGTIAGLGGLALNVQGGSSNFGTPIIGWPAQGGVNDEWLRLNTGLVSTPQQMARCLNIAGGTVGTGVTPLITWNCILTSPNEQFHFAATEWRAMGNMCVTAESASAGANISIQPCINSVFQQWTFFENANTIQLTATNLCVQVPGGNTALGTQLTLASCGGANQTFGFSQSQINFGSACFNVLGGTTSPGNRIGLWSGCGSTPPLQNEVFTIEGQVTSSGQCVNMVGGVAFDGVQIGMFPCQNNGSANEIWERYW